MSSKTVGRKKANASVGKTSAKQKSLVQSAQKSKSAAQTNSEAYIDLTLSGSDNENEDPVVIVPPMKEKHRAAAAFEPKKREGLNSTPRISNKLTLQELREEALARNIDPKSLPKTKGELLHLVLLDGSIHLKESREYKQFMLLLAKMESERTLLMQKKDSIKETDEDKRLEHQRKQQEKRDTQRIAKEKAAEECRQKQEADRIAARAAEIVAQKCLHNISCPLVHPHMLACTVLLKLNGKARDQATCSGCHRQHYRLDNAFSCEACDFDICGKCFKESNASPEERAPRQVSHPIQAKADKEIEIQQKDPEPGDEWNAEKLFTPAIIKPSTKNKSSTTKGHKYVVWSANDHDSYSDYSQDFDTSWETAKEANDRARYLFFWENPPGINPEELLDQVDPKSSFREGLASYTMKLYYNRWTVGVVPTAVFPHLRAPRFGNEPPRNELEAFINSLKKDYRQQHQQTEFDEEWDAEKLFTGATIEPPAKNKSFASKGHQYAVWSSDEYDYGGESTQHFDSSWETAKEANDRARYLFFWENPSGIDPEEVGDDDQETPKPSFREGLANYAVKLYHSRWKVGVVPIIAFPHLNTVQFSSDSGYQGF